jgi:hypothetical protein
MKFFIVGLIALSVYTHAQTPLTSIDMPGKVSDIRGMLMDDDIFLSMVFRPISGKPFTKSYFIKSNGSAVSADVDVVGDRPMIGGIRSGGNTFLYYVDKVSKRKVVRWVVLDSAGRGNPADAFIELPGKICGTYIESGDLHILCGVEDKFSLKLLRIREGVLQGETRLPLPFDIGNLPNGKVSFFDTAKPTTPKDVSAPVKIMKEDRLLWITVDEPLLDFDKGLAMNTFRTTVVKLDLSSGKSSIKSFFEPDLKFFVSAMSKGKLYRVYGNLENRKMDVYNFEDGKKGNTVSLISGKDAGRDSTYARIGKYWKTEKDIKKANVVKRVFGQLFIIEDLSPTQQLITLGHYGDQMILVTGFSSIAEVVVSAASLLIAELSEGPYSCVYYYYTGSQATEFKATYKTPLLRQIVDDYEYKLMRQKVMFDYKGYLYQPEMTYALYQKRNAKQLEIITFEK